MKKVLAAIMGLVFLASASIAQTPQTTQSSTTTKHLKKDSTPDKRYKENKTTTTHLTKSGTPDKRYKENKTKSTKTTKTTTKDSTSKK